MADAKARALTLFRALLRQCRTIERSPHDFKVRKPVEQDWGSYQFSSTGIEYQHEALLRLLPWMSKAPAKEASELTGGKLLDKTNLRRCIADEFRRQKDAPVAQQAALLDRSLVALRALIQQLNLARCSSSAVSEGVAVEATSSFDQAGRQGDEPVYVFSYRIRITNQRSDTIKVLGREWYIREKDGPARQVVKLDPSNAVVGQQPSIPAGDCFEYFSGTPASSPEAQMWGSLLVGVGAADKGGKHGGYCLAEVPPFKLHVSRGRRAAAGQ